MDLTFSILKYFEKRQFMIIERPFWRDIIEKAWLDKSVVWLMGVRRVGKTSLCQSLENVEYFDCEIPRIRQLFEDPELFLSTHKGKRLVLDEIHHLENPSQLLKIAADYYPNVKIIATGSSTLGASAKFKDTLTGRKREIWLTPLLLEELSLFGNENLKHRLLFGGFPSFFQKKQLPESDFKEWITAYWAKDIQDMFKVGKRHSFMKFADLLFAQSGGIFEATNFAPLAEVTRQTIMQYLAILEETFVINVIRPFSSHKATEIVKAPKVYGFDTGFVCYAKGWRDLRNQDLGLLWEHCVLNEINGKLQTRVINYWRDKKGREVDFVIYNRSTHSYTAIECKFNTLNRSSIGEIGENIKAFRQYYPEGENFVVTSNADKPFIRKYADITLTFVNTTDLIAKINT
jgi:predicted AAA+ superfamily ATPase